MALWIINQAGHHHGNPGGFPGKRTISDEGPAGEDFPQHELTDGQNRAHHPADNRYTVQEVILEKEKDWDIIILSKTWCSKIKCTVLFNSNLYNHCRRNHGRRWKRAAFRYTKWVTGLHCCHITFCIFNSILCKKRKFWSNNESRYIQNSIQPYYSYYFCSL